MFDTPNWRVKPTAPSARMAEVTSPKPTARVNWLIGSAVQGRPRDDRHRVHGLGGRGVVVIRPAPLGAVVRVEDQRAAAPHVLDALPSPERGRPRAVTLP